MELNKRKIKALARIHSAIHLAQVDMDMFADDCDLDEETKEAVVTEIQVMAEKMAGGDPMNMGSTGEILAYVRNHY